MQIVQMEAQWTYFDQVADALIAADWLDDIVTKQLLQQFLDYIKICKYFYR